MKQIQGHNVTDELYFHVVSLFDAAKADGINLILNSALRLKSEQLYLRRQNVIDKSKVNDEKYLMTADNGLFLPRTAKPGQSNHESGRAIDVNATPKEYAWMVKNAHSFGWIRTVPSERWHFTHFRREKAMSECSCP